jgi:hypothetical protein
MSALPQMEPQTLLPGLQAEPTEHRPRVAVWGLLAEDARMWTTGAGVSHIHVMVSQRLPGQPEAGDISAVVALDPKGAPHSSAMAAHALARRLRRGTEVMVCGEGLHPGQINGRPVLTLGKPRCVTPIDDLLNQQPSTSHLQD